MRNLSQVAFALAGISFVASLVAAFALAFPLIAGKSQVGIQLPKEAPQSLEQSIRGATNLEGLKSVCLFMAQARDRDREASQYWENHMRSLLTQGAITVLLVGLAFTCALLYMYVQLKRTGANAL